MLIRKAILEKDTEIALSQWGLSSKRAKLQTGQYTLFVGAFCTL